jgi:hypothetical protein
MSIGERIRTLEATSPPLLVRYKPVSQRKPKRRLYLADQALKEYQTDGSAVNLLVGRGFVASSMSRWVLGEHVHGSKKRGLFVDRLEPPPPEVWEMRVTEPIVQGRLLGFFAEPDALVMLRMHTRGYMGDRHPTKRDQWDETMDECRAVWDALFRGEPPLGGATIHEFVTENVDDFPLNKRPSTSRSGRLWVRPRQGCSVRRDPSPLANAEGGWDATEGFG